ncbi:hypothetical protein CNR22_17710 [Sphingobacteriaceae bacterium]|nr:hypothetical protein CNR22_17710 [Sphingobacteriaceae bacterium]
MEPVIAKSVYNTLFRLSHPLVEHLNNNLVNAHVVKDDILPKNIVSVNSVVEYVSEPYNRPVRIKIVLPEHEDLARRNVSVLAPICRALLGFKESDELVVKMPSGKKKIKILKVYN